MSSRKKRRERRQAHDAPLVGAPSEARRKPARGAGGKRSSAATPKGGSPRGGSPRAGSPRVGSPRAGSPRVGSPRVGSPRVGSPRDGSPGSGSPSAQPAGDSAGPERWTPSVKPLVGPLTDLLDADYRPTRGGELPLVERHVDALRRLSQHFTDKRNERRAGYLSTPAARAAYLLYYSLTGAATVQAALALAAQRAPFAWEAGPSPNAATPVGPTPVGPTPVGPTSTDPTSAELRGDAAAAPPRAAQPLRVLDLGAGPLTASLGVALRWPDRPLEVTAVDGSRAALKDGATLLRGIRPDAKIRLIDGNLRDGALRNQLGRGYDLVVVANVLNEFREQVRRRGTDELPAHQRSPAERVLLDALGRLAPQGRLLVLEPAARGPSRLLIALRDRLVAQREAQVLAPCVDTPACPLGDVRSRDWCFAEHPWRRPRLVKACDRMLRHKRDTLKFSYLLLAPASASPDRPETSAGRFRVIGGPMGQRPVRRYLCGPGGRVTAVLRDVRAPDAAAVAEAIRGDLVTVAGTPEQGGPRREWQLTLGKARGRSERPPRGGSR